MIYDVNAAKRQAESNAKEISSLWVVVIILVLNTLTNCGRHGRSERRLSAIEQTLESQRTKRTLESQRTKP